MAELAPAAKRMCTTAVGSVKRIAVEGNIAAGKSTFLRLLEEINPTYRVVSEPLTRWLKVPTDEEQLGDDSCNIGSVLERQEFVNDYINAALDKNLDTTDSQQHGGNLLDMFYKEPNRWAYTFQTYACVSRLRSQLRPLPPDILNSRQPVIFYERSVYSDRFIFAQNCHVTGLMSETEWHLYCDWHSFLTQSLPLKLDGIVYLRTDPKKICYGRLQKRSRPEERTVTQDYLDTIHDRHEDWLINKTIRSPSHLKDVPILSLDCDPDFEQNRSRMEHMMKLVTEFIEDGVTGTQDGTEQTNSKATVAAN